MLAPAIIWQHGHNVNIDNIRSVAKAKSYVTAHQLPYDFWLDSNSEVFKKLNGQGIPFTLIVDSEGRLISKHVGFIAGDERQFAKEIDAAVRWPWRRGG